MPADASSGTYHEALDRVVVNWRWLTDEPGYYTDRENFAILYFRIGAGAWTELGRTSCESCPWWTSVVNAVPGARPGDRIDLMAYYQMTLRSRFCHNTRKTVLVEVTGVAEIQRRALLHL